MNDSLVAEADVVGFAEEVSAAATAVGAELTFFEIATLMAFLEFRRRQVDLAVVETGLGGRLDATNVVRSSAAVITSIGLEHCDILGDTIEMIAGEKAGIIKSGTVVVTGALPTEAQAVVGARAEAEGARWLHHGRDFDEHEVRALALSGAPVALGGAHQLHNASLAVAVVRALGASFPVPETAIAEGLREVRWPGRLETLGSSPLTLVDAAHNPHAVDALVSTLESLALPRPRVLVFGVMSDKDWPRMLRRLVPLFDRVVLVPVANRRALDPSGALALTQ